MRKFINLDFIIPFNNDLALLILRLWFGIGLFVKHGVEKFTNFNIMQSHFPDPLHIGTTPGLVFALISDGICSLLIVAGLATRIAALFITLNMLVVFALLHHFSFMEDHAELVYTFLGGFLVIFLAGPGKYSLDRWLLSARH